MAMTFEEIVRAGMSELTFFQEGRNAAKRRLEEAEGLREAASGQDKAIFAVATVDLENARAVASDWGLDSIADEITREAAGERGPLWPS
jgi:hypothetical protein